MRQPNYPALYQINTRVWLTELSRTLGRPVTLDDILEKVSTFTGSHHPHQGLCHICFPFLLKYGYRP
jgi:hypothetical protein